MSSSNRPADTWVPQYFLASVGAGGLAVSFFLWLYMWIPHPGQQVPVFEDIFAAWTAGSPLARTMIALVPTAAVLAIALSQLFSGVLYVDLPRTPWLPF